MRILIIGGSSFSGVWFTAALARAPRAHVKNQGLPSRVLVRIKDGTLSCRN